MCRKLLLLAAIVVGVTSIPVGVKAGSNDEFNELLTFDDDQVPPGWEITFPYGGPGRNARVGNDRFNIGQVDTYAALDKAKTLPAGTSEVHISIECSVMNVYFGSGYQIHILTSDGGDFVVGLGKEGDGNLIMDAFAGNYYALEFDQSYTPRFGNYVLDAVFKSGEIDLTATREKNGRVFASAVVPVPELDITKLQLVRLFGIMTSNHKPAWIDNALIEALP